MSYFQISHLVFQNDNENIMNYYEITNLALVSSDLGAWYKAPGLNSPSPALAKCVTCLCALHGEDKGSECDADLSESH